MSGTDSLESRRFVRVRYNTHGTLDVLGKRYNITIENLSLKGALVSHETTTTIPPATTGILHVPLESEDASEITMNVTLRYRREPHLGLKWVGIDLESISRLRRLLELNSGNPDEIKAEINALSR